MAFEASKFGRVTSSANSNQPVVWSYNAGADSNATVAGSGYFNAANTSGYLKAGDIILAVTGSNAKMEVLVVSGVSPVTTILTTAITT